MNVWGSAGRNALMASVSIIDCEHAGILVRRITPSTKNWESVGYAALKESISITDWANADVCVHPANLSTNALASAVFLALPGRSSITIRGVAALIGWNVKNGKL